MRDQHFPALGTLCADVRTKRVQEVPINNLTVRLATEVEIEFWDWHREMLARDA